MERDETYVKALGQAVRNLRKAKGYSQESFADAVGLHRTYMGAIERGEQNLTVKNIVKVADTLGLKPSKLLAEAEKLL
ncbi:MAG TPA: helix-turn-helix transcriptional regulator [Pseudobdellovibrionaceae bacterium]|jgi:transcriptional regulator with XRE-family HTH domain